MARTTKANPVNWFEIPVKDIGAALRKFRASGGKTVLPKTAIGAYGAIAQFDDTDGNRLALHAMK